MPTTLLDAKLPSPTDGQANLSDDITAILPSVLPPAVTLPLTGQYIIEASAGTGKTWTLTGILLRLLIEGGVPCEKIIATTFTRAAAAEMRERIRARLTTMLSVLRLCVQALSNLTTTQDNPEAVSFSHTHSPEQNPAKDYQRFLAEVINLSSHHQLAAQVQDDAIHWHLVQWLAKQYFGIQNSLSNETTLITTPTNIPISNSTGINAPHVVESQEGNLALPTDNQKPASMAIDFRVAIQRTMTALNQLDKLFVGTLDSLCQKWLREFSAETGFTPNSRINTQPDPVILDLVHDKLRAYRAWLAQQAPEVFEMMMTQRLFASANAYLPVIHKALTFYSTPIDSLSITPIDYEQLKAAVTAFTSLTPQDSSLQQFGLYLDKDYRSAQGFVGNGKLHLRFEHYTELARLLREQQVGALIAIQEPALGWLESLADCIEMQKGFKKNFDTQRDTFIQNPVVQRLYRIYQAKQVLDTYITQTQHYFVQYISRYVRQQLPLVLEARGQTTFSLQLARLNHALEGKQGKALARYIRHQYPVILIDESQDINTEQAMLIQQIYLDSVVKPHTPAAQADTDQILQDLQSSMSKAIAPTLTLPTLNPPSLTPLSQGTSRPSKAGFLLLVGDPKQAIYGFRGGDVSNYTALKNQFTTQPLALTQNFRSSGAVIHALNHWFGVPDSATEQQISQQPLLPEQPYTLGEQISYRYIQASRAQSDLVQRPNTGSTTSTASTLPKLAKSDTSANATADSITDELSVSAGVFLLAISPEIKPLTYADVVAAQILALMDSEQGYRYKDKPLQLGQLCVLADTNRQLDIIEHALHQRGIATLRGGTQSVFSAPMTQELIALMQAMLHPYDIASVRRLLMGHFFGLTLAEVTLLATKSETPTTLDTVQMGQPIATADFVYPFTLTAITEVLHEAGKKWLSSGFLSAVQWLLNCRFQIPFFADTAPNSFWQRLATVEEGERLLIDLRHLLDIISQRTKGFGEHQLLQWLMRMASEQPKEDWSLQQRLPSEDGVQMMTIHQSKGLEFVIVFVVGLDKKLPVGNQPPHLYLYTPPAATAQLINAPLTPQGQGQQFEQNSKQNPKLRLKQTLGHRRLTPLASDSEQDYASLTLQSDYEEKLRLAYVAFTRARDRLYIVAQASTKKASPVALNHWLVNKEFELPDRLVGIIPKVDINSLSKYMHSQAQYSPHNTQQANQHANNATFLYQLRDYQQWVSGITQTGFIGWSNTSFTALARQLNHQKQDVAIHEPDYDGFDEAFNDVNEINDSLARQKDSADADTAMINIPTTKPLRFSFERGTNAGTFLHKILETLPAENITPLSALPVTSQLPVWRDESYYLSAEIQPLLNTDHQLYVGQDSAFEQLPTAWQAVIERAVDNYQIGAQYRVLPKVSNNSGTPSTLPQPKPTQDWVSIDYLALIAWLANILHTPLGASGQTLNAIPTTQKLHELNFNMSLRRDFSIAMLNELFLIEGVTLNLYHNTQLASYWRYLRGEIDLVYQHEGKFFVVDYKSNYLGDSFEAYHQTALQHAMTEHGYWLQASIYQVALHRYLQLRLPNYEIERHLGAVEYVFLRGMHPDKADYGKLVWQPSPTFILALDMLFGKAEQS